MNRKITETSVWGRDHQGILESGGGEDACPCDRCCSNLPKEESISNGSRKQGFREQWGRTLPTIGVMNQSWRVFSPLLQVLQWSSERGIILLAMLCWFTARLLMSFSKVLGSTWRGKQVKQCFVDSRAQHCQSNQGMGLMVRHYVALILIVLLHKGEAINPGPSSQGRTWTLGTFNPSGLNGKQQILTEHLAYGDIWAVAETHLSSRALQTFRKGLGCSQSPFRYVVGGHPTPVRAHSQHSGSWIGVATISRFPTRPVPVVWPVDAFQTSRVQVVTTLCHDVWISGGIVYGEPPGIHHPHAKQHTEKLLVTTIEAVLQLPGCRYVAGDWNFQIGQLDAFQILERHGFKDLQTIAQERWGRVPQATCKGVTRKDFMFVSQELQELLIDVKIEHDVWSDHSVLAGIFQGGPKQVKRFHWRMPRSLPWPKEFVKESLDLDVSFESMDPTKAYQALWGKVETQAEQIASKLGEPAIVPAMKGRGATLNTVEKCGVTQQAPLKPSRKGDIVPAFHGASVKHAQWFRQLRRLQAYCRFVRAKPHDTEHAHGAQLWHSIVQAKGFANGFVVWWCQDCGTQIDGAPCEIPLIAPTLAVAEAIYHSFTVEVRKLETSLQHERRKHSIKRREEQATLVFRDVKAVPPARVDVLLKGRQSTILDVCTQDSFVTLDEPLELDCTKPCVINGRQYDIVHAEAEWVYLTDVTGIEPLQVLTQHRFVGKMEEMFKEFETEWTKRWNRHQNVSQSQWDQIVAFAKATLPFRSCSFEDITPQQLHAEIVRKKKHSATGPDGVSLEDLKNMPHQVLQQLCEMLNRAEKTGEWPVQTLVGKVASLAKTMAPSTVSQYRPITIFSQIYRLWGSLRSRQLLKALDCICPPDLLGNRPGKHAMQLWMYVQWRVETSHITGQELSGVTADIQKAFNHLPREVVMATGLCVGIPNRVLVAWAGALSQMTRRFEIRDSLGPPITSCTGCPEGCSMSCVGMLLIDLLFHHWVSKQCPMAEPLSYVDDWQVLTTDTAQVPAILTSLNSFTNEVDLLLDQNKTFSWSTGVQSRKQLRSQQVPIRTQARGLGAQMQFTRQHRSQVVLERMQELAPLWQRLKQSLSPYFLKVRVLSRAAWPKGLHAVGATHLGPSRFSVIRAGAMRGIEANGSGCNAWVHLGMIETPDADPQYWAIKETLRGVRLCQTEPQLTVLLDLASRSPDLFPLGGPTCAFVNRVHTLGWSIHPGVIVQDHWGQFSFFGVSYQELVLRAEASWKFVVASKVAKRSCFDGLHNADPYSTRRFLSLLTVGDQGLFRKALNGAAFTNDILYHFTEAGTTSCNFCGAPDSRTHRFWHCPAFEQERQTLPADIVDLVPDLPSCLTQAGWAIQSPTHDLWWQTLCQVEVGDPAPLQVAWEDPNGWVDLFTDGSCQFPKDMNLRFASWSVCRAHANIHLNESTVIAAGGLPGIIQSSYRAELFAVVQALKWAARYNTKVRIWSDCQGVVSKVQKLSAGTWVPSRNSSHFDLWDEAQTALDEMQAGACVITKVAAHQDIHAAASFFEQWAFMHNALADRAARVANLCRPPAFWDVQRRHQHQVHLVQRVNGELQKVILAVSKSAVQRTQLEEAVAMEVGEEQVTVPSTSLLTMEDEQCPVALTDLAPLPVAQRFGHRLTAMVAAWLHEGLQQAAENHERCRWVSWIQLYVDFQQRTGDAGPYYDKGWQDPNVRTLLKARQYNFRKRCSWFVQLVKQIMKANAIHLKGSVTRPDSVMLALHTASIYIAWPSQRTQFTEKWFHQVLSKAATRDGKSLNSLPIAKQLDGQVDLCLQVGPLGR